MLAICFQPDITGTLEKKNLYIIAGCNGAGKTTAALSLFPEILESFDFVNADEIAREMRQIDPNVSDITAGRVMLSRIDKLIELKQDFAIETTLASKSLMRIISDARKTDYFVTLLFYWLNTPELAIERVRSRVLKGGHDIPVNVIIRRYYAGITNLFNLYMKESDYWIVFDNSGDKEMKVAEGHFDEIIEIKKSDTFTYIREQYEIT